MKTFGQMKKKLIEHEARIALLEAQVTALIEMYAPPPELPDIRTLTFTPPRKK